MVFVFGSVYVMDCIYIFAYIELALCPWDETYLNVMNKLFDVLLQVACQYFIEFLCTDVHHGYWPQIFFFSCVSATFCYQEDVGLIICVREDSLFSYCLE